MASFNSDIYTAQRASGTYAPLQNNTTPPLEGNNGIWTSRMDDSRRLTAGLEWADVIYTVAGTEANTDTFNLLNLPIGAIVYAEHCFVYRETSPGTTLTVNIGDSAVAARYAAALPMGGASGTVTFVSSGLPSGVTTRFQLTAATMTVIATVSAATSGLSAGAKLHFKIAYKVLQP